jgi:hypothetical protein
LIWTNWQKIFADIWVPNILIVMHHSNSSHSKKKEWRSCLRTHNCVLTDIRWCTLPSTVAQYYSTPRPIIRHHSTTDHYHSLY